MLSFVYRQVPHATAPCGAAEDQIQWQLSPNCPGGAIVQEVTRSALIYRNGASEVATTETFYELWDVVVVAPGPPVQIAIMGTGLDVFAWHPQAGESPNQTHDTKGDWTIRGVARFLPRFDVLVAIQNGENWQRGVIPGAGLWLYTLTQPPASWDRYTGEIARELRARWNCFPDETRLETDVSGSGQIAP